MYTLTHEWSDQDTSYNIPNSSTVVNIGLASYSNNLRLYDFSPSRPNGSESGVIDIGRYTSIADQVSIHLFGNHDYQKVTTSPLMPIIDDYKQEMEAEPAENVVIGNDVWIGNNALILSNVVVGDGSVIGANCVVGKSVPPYAVVVGNPMRIIKYRFEHEIIESLLKIKWWEWDLSKVKSNSEFLQSRSVESFIKRHL